jgi:hypothetical protein
MKAIIFKRTPHLLEKTHMIAFHVSYAWINSFIKNPLNWSYCVSIIAIGELPKDY